MNKSSDCVDYIRCRVFNLCRKNNEFCKSVEEKENDI